MPTTAASSPARFADYLMPTTTEVPAPLILHFESPSPFTPLGAKGVGEGNCMSTPVCIANAVADALGVAEIDLPLTPAKLAALVPGRMKPAPFDYVRAETLAEAHDVLAAEGSDAAVIAGGQTLVPLLSMRMARPKRGGRHHACRGAWRHRGRGQCDPRRRVGAAGRIAGVAGAGRSASRCSRRRCPGSGTAQTRARGTVCGSVALADPSAELPLCWWRSAATSTLSSQARTPQRDGGRFLHRADVDRAPRRRADRGRVVSLPRAPGEGFAFREFARRHGDFAIVACAAVATAKSVRLAVGGVADRPVVRDFD